MSARIPAFLDTLYVYFIQAFVHQIQSRAPTIIVRRTFYNSQGTGCRKKLPLFSKKESMESLKSAEIEHTQHTPDSPHFANFFVMLRLEE